MKNNTPTLTKMDNKYKSNYIRLSVIVQKYHWAKYMLKNT